MSKLERDGYDPECPPDVPIIVNPNKVNISGQGHFNSEWRRRRNGIIDALLIAGIIALVTATIGIMRTTDKVETAFTERSKRYDGEISRIDDTIERHDERITNLEREQRESDAYPHYRQKR